MKTLRLTTTQPMSMFRMLTSEQEPKPLIVPNDKGELELCNDLKGKSAYIHGDAQSVAGFDIPTFIDGNMAQLDLPVEQQNILLMLPSGNYRCVSEIHYNKYNNNKPQYHITLKK